ncbi:hypothetical protein C9374_009539 [Naegleria lovaniensis]|uniref:NADP-dependent oxidoreductase domain-containing protein n=1 Tax=Naegleria lovaniensis TaxID=51637 RepID=A0AA88KR66_NAELO|nr:uncharacterized protein C9374_009539 [Naegleria lovaniensis]KAG2392962.1 hypothetical protein C9374_009539 [Naegleria lovaniensis]
MSVQTSSSSSLVPNVELHNGVKMPIIGLGTWEVNQSPQCEQCIFNAIEIGYRHIDTACIYRNEKLIGQVLKQCIFESPQKQHSENTHHSKLNREDLFITSKLPPTRVQSEDIIRETFMTSLEELQLSYLDCYLIHWPGTSKLKVTSDQNRLNRIATWRVLEKLYREGKTRSIGVSNFTYQHMIELLEDIQSREDGIIPHVNQIEYHPLLYKTHAQLEDLCKQHSIIIQAYSPLAHGELMQGKYGQVTSRECLQWILQRGHVILPRSIKRNHLEENFKAVTDWASNIIEDQSRLKRLDQLVENEVRICWNPETIK